MKRCCWRSREASLLSQSCVHNFACALTNFWKSSVCTSVIESSNRRLGAATFHYQVISQILRANGTNVCFVQPTYRPFDCDFGLVNKLQRYHQYQVLLCDLNESPIAIFQQSLKALGLSNDCRLVFRKSNWRSESLIAWGIGWECLLNGVEIAQITLFKQVCGILCVNSVCEIAYGLERLNFALSGKVLKPSQLEIARCVFHKNIATSRLIRRLKSIAVQTNSIKFTNDKRFHWCLLSFTDVYNRLTAKTTVKRSVMRKILTKIQLNVKFITQNSFS
ncbi:MAG: glycine--tRNA ligase subunit alpha [Candidatus Hodgkinia cicadicola]